ncbi:MAG: type I-U CRISPR-associated protein Cas7 [Deltaproteobacteria bacterium]|nr:type I-U CRISPR-associated protein Cas7 [Deltaproteobacteria bacterium]
MNDPPVLTIEKLEEIVAGAAAIRCITRLQPGGGPGDKVFPPTYHQDDKRAVRYATEQRRVNGHTVDTVLLDSVASQANRMEEALLEAWESSETEFQFPVLSVNFEKVAGLERLGKITTLQAPHRIADAIFRDSILGDGPDKDKPFRQSTAGQAYTEASPKNATAVFQYCPTGLVFGVWDSTGPRGGMGNKFQRALVSEIVGVGAVVGKKTESRLDPLGIPSSVVLYERDGDDSDWTTNAASARKETVDKKEQPKKFTGGSKKNPGRPSLINHGNVAPTLDITAGGVTFDYAQQTTVLSLPALRRLRFQNGTDGKPLLDRPAAELAARTALAALALNGVVLAHERGHDLRSRSLLVPETRGPLVLEVIFATSDAIESFRLGRADAATLLKAASECAAKRGLCWKREPISLRPEKKLEELVRESWRVAAKRAPDAQDDEES